MKVIVLVKQVPDTWSERRLDEDGRGGVLPAMVAEKLGVAALTSVDTLTFNGAAMRGERSADGVDETLEAALPAVVSITERMPDARFARALGSAERWSRRSSPRSSHAAERPPTARHRVACGHPVTLRPERARELEDQ